MYRRVFVRIKRKYVRKEQNLPLLQENPRMSVQFSKWSKDRVEEDLNQFSVNKEVI